MFYISYRDNRPWTIFDGYCESGALNPIYGNCAGPYATREKAEDAFEKAYNAYFGKENTHE